MHTSESTAGATQRRQAAMRRRGERSPVGCRMVRTPQSEQSMPSRHSVDDVGGSCCCPPALARSSQRPFRARRQRLRRSCSVRGAGAPRQCACTRAIVALVTLAISMHRRARWRAAPVGNAKTHSTPSHDDGVESKWLPSRRRRRRRRLLRGRQAAGRGTTFGAGCAAQRAASAPLPPHLHSTRAHSAPSIRAAGTSWPELESPSAAPP